MDYLVSFDLESLKIQYDFLMEQLGLIHVYSSNGIYILMKQFEFGSIYNSI